MDEKKRELLTQLEKFFKEDEDVEEASLFTKEELGTPMDIVRVLVTGYGPGLRGRRLRLGCARQPQA